METFLHGGSAAKHSGLTGRTLSGSDFRPRLVQCDFFYIECCGASKSSPLGVTNPVPRISQRCISTALLSVSAIFSAIMTGIRRLLARTTVGMIGLQRLLDRRTALLPSMHPRAHCAATQGGNL